MQALKEAKNQFTVIHLFFFFNVTLTVLPIQDAGRYILPELSELLPTRLKMSIVFPDFRSLGFFIRSTP
jgi:hypothetical protein